MMEKLKITLEDWDYTCGDGCCYDYGTKLYLNGEELENPMGDKVSNAYLGGNVGLSLKAVLMKLGYEIEIIEK